MTQRTPFKFLDAYTQADRDIFCGRDADIEELHARALQNRLLLVYGPSGVGKTSLIQCGLMNKFPAADRLPLTIRYDGNLFAALDRAIAALTKSPIPPDRSLTEKLQALYFEYFTPITLIFDQLEELFIFGATDERDRFAADIAALLDAPFKLRILFVIREEYLAELTAFETQLPDLFANRLRVERMSHANVRRAIEEPCEACGVAVESGLAEEIIARLGASKSGTVELTYLQVVLDKLYERSLTRHAEAGSGAANAVSLTVTDLAALGELGDILGAFLSEQLAALPHEQAALGEALLKTLVTPDGTKKALNAPEIADALRSMGQTGDQAEIAAILNHFVAVRLLTEKEESGRYELRHDSLAQKIFERMTALEKDLLEIMQLLENRCSEYHKRGTLLDAATLDYVAPYESRVRLNAAFAELILRSRSEVTRRRRRFMTAFIAAASAVFLIVAGLGGLSYLKYREAETQRQRAEQQKEFALKASNMLTDELVDKLKNFAGTKPILTKILIQNAAQLAEMVALDRDDQRAQREQALNLNRLGDLWMVLGDTAAALTAYQQSFDISQRLVNADPLNIDAQRTLSVSYNKLGTVQLRLGHPAEALSAYQQSFNISKQLAEADPKSTEAQRDLSFSYNRLGDTQLQLGNTAAALSLYQQGLEIRQRLVETDSANMEAQRAISLSYENIGDAQMKLGDTVAALNTYQQCLAIRQRLAQADFANMQAQRDLSISYYRIGDVHEQLGDMTAALNAYQQSFDIFKQIAEVEPTNAEAQRDLSFSYRRIGDIQEQLGDIDAALSAYQQSLTIHQRLIQADPENTQAQRDILHVYSGMGYVFWKQGKLEDAANTYANGLKVDPKDVDLLSNDAELAFVQGDLERYQARISAAMPLVNSDNQLFAILPFYAYLSNPTQGWENVLTAINSLSEDVKITWDFSTTAPALERLDAKTQKTAQEFIAFFEGKIDLPTLKARLEGR